MACQTHGGCLAPRMRKGVAASPPAERLGNLLPHVPHVCLPLHVPPTAPLSCRSHAAILAAAPSLSTYACPATPLLRYPSVIV